MFFDLAAARRGEHWKLDTIERQEVGEKLANVLRHVNLPERELGIAADVASLGLVFYAITVPRLELDKRRAAATTSVGVGTVPPTPTPRSPAVGDTRPDVVQELDAVMREAFPNGFDMTNPEHVHRLNAIAAGVTTDSPIEVGGDALDTSRPVTGDVHSTPGFFPADNGGQ